jgi:hypothetical protein
MPAAASCESKGEIRWVIEMKKKESRKTAYCSPDGAHRLLSKSCAEDKCSKTILAALEKTKAELNYSPMGSPGFQLCEKMLGTPRFVSFRLGKAWKETSACELPGKLWVDNTTLLDTYIANQK